MRGIFLITYRLVPPPIPNWILSAVLVVAVVMLILSHLQFLIGSCPPCLLLPWSCSYCPTSIYLHPPMNTASVENGGGSYW